MNVDYDDDSPLRHALRRVCVHATCRETAIGTDAKRCRKHHAAYIRAWRAARRTKSEIISPPSRPTSSSAPEAVRERVRTSRARVRGTLKPLPCAVCGAREGVVALRPSDPTGPIVWGHRGCRATIVGGDRERRAASAVRTALEAQASFLDTALSKLLTLPNDVVVQLRAKAGTGPFTIRAESPLYQQRLAMLVEGYLRSRDAG